MGEPYEVHIRTTGDSSGADQVKQDLREIKEEAARPVPKIVDSEAPLNGPDAAAAEARRLAAQEEFAAQQLADEERIQALRAEGAVSYQEWQAANAAIAEQQAAAAAAAASALSAAEERRNAILIERQALIASETEALILEADGQVEQAAALTKEIELRRAALTIQQTTNLSQEESLLLAQQRVAAEEQIAAAQLAQRNSSGLAGVNIGRARQEATTLAREIAAGGANMRTVGALAGSLGASLGTGIVGALVLSETIGAIGEHMDKTRINSEKQGVELQKQVKHWREMAAAAKDFADVQNLNKDIAEKITEIQEKVRQLPSEAGEGFLTTWINGAKILANNLTLVQGVYAGFETSTEKATKKLREQEEQLRSSGKTYEDSARRQVEAVRAIIALPYPEAIRKAQTEIARLSLEQENLNRSDKKQEESWQRKQGTIASLARAIDELSQHNVLLQRQEELAAQVGRESDPTRRASLQKDLDELREKLLITKRIKEATDDAAVAHKAFTKEEAQDIENEVKGPLAAKVKILRELAQLNPAGGFQKQIDKLLEVKPPDAATKEKASLEAAIANAKSTAAELERAKAQLQLILERELRELDKGKAKGGTPDGGKPVTESLDRFGDQLKLRQSADEFKKAGDDAFEQVALSLQSIPAALREAAAPIPAAIDQSSQGVRQNIEALGSSFVANFQEIGHAVIAVKADTDRRLESLQQQINSLARPTPQ
jgi:hypothetical protein